MLDISKLGKVLAVIPARGGSKGVPRKNIRSLAGKPLIAYSIESAQSAAPYLYRTVVSTDDPEIATLSKQLGGDVPFMRPEELSGDKVPMLPVLQHAVSFVEAQDKVNINWVLLLQPTNPIRDERDFLGVLQLAQSEACDSIISVVQVFAEHPILMKKIENNRLLPFCVEEKEGTRRQDYFPPAFMRNGAFYLTRRDVLMNQHSLWGKSICPFVMPEERSVGIDNELDFKLLSLLLAEEN